MTEKQSHLYSSPEGVIKLIEGDKMPPEPIQTNAWNGKDYRENAFNNSQKVNYEAALQRAKEQAVTVADQEKAKRIIMQWLNDQPLGQGMIEPERIYGPFSLRYEIEFQWRPYSTQNWQSTNEHYWLTVGGSGNLCAEKRKVAILYDDTPEKEHPGLRDALREVKAKNKELRDSYKDPTRLDFRIKDSRGFPTGEVIEEAKVTPEKEESHDYKQAYLQQCERNDAIAKDLEYWAQKSADLLKELEQLRKTMKSPCRLKNSGI